MARLVSLFQRGTGIASDAAERESVSVLRDLPKARYATRPALSVYPETLEGKKRVYSHLDVYRMVERLGGSLRELGIRPRTVVALMMPNSLEMVVSFFALQWVNAVAVPVDLALPEEDIERTLRSTEAKLILAVDAASTVIEGYAEKVVGVATRLPALVWRVGVSRNEGVLLDSEAKAYGPPAWHGGSKDFTPDENMVSILAISPGSSPPLILPLSHRSIIAAAKSFSETYGLVYEEERNPDVAIAAASTHSTAPKVNGTVLAAPLSDVHGFLLVVSSFYSGGWLTVPPYGLFRPEELPTYVDNDSVSWISVDEELFQQIYASASGAAATTSSRPLSFIRVCGGKMLPEDMREVFAAVMRCPVLSSYGPPEGSGLVTTETFDAADVGGLGPAVTRNDVSVIAMSPSNDTEVILLEPMTEGEIAISGDNVVEGFWKNDAETAAYTIDVSGTRWLRTGDRGFLDTTGKLHLTSTSRSWRVEERELRERERQEQEALLVARQRELAAQESEQAKAREEVALRVRPALWGADAAHHPLHRLSAADIASIGDYWCVASPYVGRRPDTDGEKMLLVRRLRGGNAPLRGEVANHMFDTEPPPVAVGAIERTIAPAVEAGVGAKERATNFTSRIANMFGGQSSVDTAAEQPRTREKIRSLTPAASTASSAAGTAAAVVGGTPASADGGASSTLTPSLRRATKFTLGDTLYDVHFAEDSDLELVKEVFANAAAVAPDASAVSTTAPAGATAVPPEGSDAAQVRPPPAAAAPSGAAAVSSALTMEVQVVSRAEFRRFGGHLRAAYEQYLNDERQRLEAEYDAVLQAAQRAQESNFRAEREVYEKRAAADYSGARTSEARGASDTLDAERSAAMSEFTEPLAAYGDGGGAPGAALALLRQRRERDVAEVRALIEEARRDAEASVAVQASGDDGSRTAVLGLSSVLSPAPRIRVELVDPRVSERAVEPEELDAMREAEESRRNDVLSYANVLTMHNTLAQTQALIQQRLAQGTAPEEELSRDRELAAAISEERENLRELTADLEKKAFERMKSPVMYKYDLDEVERSVREAVLMAEEGRASTEEAHRVVATALEMARRAKQVADSTSESSASVAASARESASSLQQRALAERELPREEPENSSSIYRKKIDIDLTKIDEVMRRHPSVRDARAFAVPSYRSGCKVFCVVQLYPGARVSEAWLRKHAQKLMPLFMVPRRFLYAPSGIPPGRNGLSSMLSFSDNLSVKSSDLAGGSSPGAPPLWSAA